MHCFVKRILYKPFFLQQCSFSTLRIGVDEAGRGAVLGPLVISSILLDDKEEQELKKLGIKDSKQMTSQKRFQCYEVILEKAIRSYSFHISSLTIDKQRQLGLSLNRIEENHIFNLLHRFQDISVDTVILDAFVSKNNRLEVEATKLFPNSKIICEFHADATYPCVAAASVIAKVFCFLFHFYYLGRERSCNASII